MQEQETPAFVATIAGAPVATPAPVPVPAFAPTAEQRVVTAPTAEQSAVTAPPPRRRPRARGRRSRPRRVMTRVLLAGIVVAFAVYAVGTGSNLVQRLRDGASVRTVPADGRSLLRAVALERALQALPPAAQVESLRVSADRLEARVAVGNRVRLVRVTERGWVAETPSTSAPTGARVRIDPRAPARLIRTVTRRTGRSPARVAHVTLETARWQLVFKDGAQFSANVHGRDVRRG
ncbi:hypothetical protein OJ997_21820 [Solirubrobacter phytolaccae]|uniref:Uncharacterized protein n=1 Tax=Solirubrobacter phytolaccae TaxID=1404360 RepID=A0A9X3NAS5_9ACTN|nr:hypothetical protein [Solirubrobacter phytolaccae]MDA0182963.1 hypothetical protein [Solirubrobacter phytolaccae]